MKESRKKGTGFSQSKEKRFGDPATQMNLPIPFLGGDENPSDPLEEGLGSRRSPLGEHEQTPLPSFTVSADQGTSCPEQGREDRIPARTRKMEAMGTLASGIAHDFNNILTPIFLRTEMAMAQLDEKSPLRHQLEQVLACGQRAKDLVQQILNFSRQNDRELRPLQISLVVKELLKLFRSSLPATIEIRQDIAGTGAVVADLTLIHLLVSELCVGTAQEMRDQGGVLEVSLKDVDIDGEDGTEPVPLPKGSYVKLSVKQRSHGASPPDRPQGPFAEEDAGPRISLVRNIASQHGGQVVAYREADNGTTCHVFLPRMDEERSVSNQAEPSALPRGTERILLVDDEKEVLETFEQMLAYLGYRVVSSPGAPDALEIFRRAPDDFDLLITDQTMPKITGVQLAAEVNRIRPELPVLLCSGYDDEVQREEARKVGVQEVVMKPITASEIAHKVRRALETPQRKRGPLAGGKKKADKERRRAI